MLIPNKDKNGSYTVITDAVKKMILIAYSSGYEHGHHDTVEGLFSGRGRSEDHDWLSSEWLEEAISDGTFDRDIEI